MKPTFVRSDMLYWRLKPDPRLGSRVLCYYIAVPAPGRPARQAVGDEELLLPDGYAELVFNLAAGFERWPVGEVRRRAVMRPSYVIGGRTHSVVTRALGALKVIGAKLDPRFLRLLIGTPLVELRDSIVSLPDLNNEALLDLEDSIANARSPAAIGNAFDQFFLAALRNLPRCEPTVGALLRRVRSERGALSVMRWMRDHRADPRNFERRFCAWIGMTPKRYARIVRFKHGYYRLTSNKIAAGAIGSHLEDYHDQSHFYRDFKYFTGVAPATKVRGKMQQETDISDHLIEGELAPERPADG